MVFAEEKTNGVKINLVILILILCAVGGWTFFSSQTLPEKRLLNPAPDFKYTALDGTKGNLKQYQGQVVLVHFWATWCAPCLIEFPELLGLAQASKDDLVLLAVAVADDPEKIEKFLQGSGVDIPANVRIVMDPDKAISESLYGTFKLPETYLISTDTEILEHLVGAQENWNSDVWKDKISQLASE